MHPSRRKLVKIGAQKPDNDKYTAKIIGIYTVSDHPVRFTAADITVAWLHCAIAVASVSVCLSVCVGVLMFVLLKMLEMNRIIDDDVRTGRTEIGGR